MSSTQDTVTTRRVIVLGSTGSIGTQTLDVIAHLNALADAGNWHERYTVVGLAAAGSRAGLLAKQARAHKVHDLAVCDPDAAIDTHDDAPVRIRRGSGAAEQLVGDIPCDLVVGAMVGSAGITATLAALQQGTDVALANKETLVAAGQLVVPLAQQTGAQLLPIDSEHSGVWQCLRAHTDCAHMPATSCNVARITLTASGGPFRTWSAADTHNATVDQALAHPTWSMGPKVTVDSASLMNKALELIEARWLFGLRPDQLAVVVHPQSIVHALVEHADASIIAQLGPPDMRGPIQYALARGHRCDASIQRLDLASLGSLTFEAPDRDRFPALDLAWRVMEQAGTSGAVLNGANEAAVQRFLAGNAPFGWIGRVVTDAMNTIGTSPVNSLDDVWAAEHAARDFVHAQSPS